MAVVPVKDRKETGEPLDSALAEGLSATRKSLLRLLKEKGQATATEIGKCLGISRVAVHHHLKALGEVGWVASEVVRGRKGRPAEVFSLTQKAQESLFPRRYDQLAKLVLESVGSDFGDDYLLELFRRHRRSLFDPFLGSECPLSEKVKALADYLDHEGYLVKFEERDDGYVLILHNCPIEMVAKAYPQACTAELEMLQLVTGTTVERPCHQAKGDNCCLYFIPKQTTKREKEER
ncbi:MAG: helix-turn-helix domain-containing protein [Armatimonadetes bacterium]|nr:helix-turn-helix domain-containing protein [Armatimonadota bacterium]MDW8120817.1 helix-turn-helix domain-containing protein [Armatimonadota bacterium]